MIWARREHIIMKMKHNVCLVVPLMLLFSMTVRCVVFDDQATVRTARCYANCITMVSNIPMNDTSCLSSQCLECKIPCDRIFDSVENCTQKCPNGSILCNRSCTFLGVTKTWTNIYQGNGSIIGKPGVVQNTARNVTTLTLSWQPSVNASGTVVYLLKETMTGDMVLPTPTLLKGLVFLEPTGILPARDACSMIKPNTWRSNYDGINFAFTVVALTEVSALAEGQQSSPLNFQKADPIASLYNASLFYNPNAFANKLEFLVWFTPSSSSSVDPTYVGIPKKTGGECSSLHIQVGKAKKESNSNRLLMHFYEKTKTCNISFTAYSLTECLPSKPNSIEYYYKGCHYLPSMNTSFCCTFDPLPTPDSAKRVRNLTYSLQTQSDFRFTANITWLPPTQPCPVAASYRLSYMAYNSFFRTLVPQSKPTIETYFIMPNMLPNLERNVTVIPYFGSGFHDLGIDKPLTINTPGFPPNETIITNLQHQLQYPASPADRFSLNISWIKPKFGYSRIENYNVTYKTLGKVTKSKTLQLWYVVRGLDYSQKVSYEVLPVYNHTWIPTKPTKGQEAILPVLKDEELVIQDFNHSFIKTNDFYRLLVQWSPPSFQRNVLYYEVSYKLTGYSGDELDCTPKSSNKNNCLPNRTTNTSYTINNLRQKEQIEMTVTPVFENTHAFQGKPSTMITRPPDWLEQRLLSKEKRIFVICRTP